MTDEQKLQLQEMEREADEKAAQLIAYVEGLRDRPVTHREYWTVKRVAVAFAVVGTVGALAILGASRFSS